MGRFAQQRLERLQPLHAGQHGHAGDPGVGNMPAAGQRGAGDPAHRVHVRWDAALSADVQPAGVWLVQPVQQSVHQRGRAVDADAGRLVHVAHLGGGGARGAARPLRVPGLRPHVLDADVRGPSVDRPESGDVGRRLRRWRRRRQRLPAAAATLRDHPRDAAVLVAVDLLARPLRHRWHVPVPNAGRRRHPGPRHHAALHAGQLRQRQHCRGWAAVLQRRLRRGERRGRLRPALGSVEHQDVQPRRGQLDLRPQLARPSHRTGRPAALLPRGQQHCNRGRPPRDHWKHPVGQRGFEQPGAGGRPVLQRQHDVEHHPEHRQSAVGAADRAVAGRAARRGVPADLGDPGRRF
mmetsp:Transcript_24597/g.64108  ORF Transcript_24597/g.64108 Transcript_24597/m.64108 type:complete len:350 (+) Transcript_24597:1104-2153(+)